MSLGLLKTKGKTANIAVAGRFILMRRLVKKLFQKYKKMHFGLLRLLFARRFNFEIDSSGLIENKTERMIFMSKIAVVYWSGTGNTEAMANAVLEGQKCRC